MEAREYYTYLLKRYYYGQSSNEEVEELFAELQKNLDAEEWTSMIRELHLSAGEDQHYYPARWQAIADRIITTPMPLIVQRPVRRINPFWWMAAAVAVVVIVAGVVWTNMDKKSEQMVQTPTQKLQEPKPGGNKAMLTLADGRQLDLTAATNGTQATENGVPVAHTGDGKLVYEKDAKAETAGLHTLSTPRGGQYQLSLPDGTKVWLNAASSITYPPVFKGSHRNISVNGEAYFEVVENPKQPFRISISDRSVVEVLGTHFNINAYPDEPQQKTTLIEGSIRISAGNKKQLLAPGEQVSINASGVFEKSEADISAVLAWKNGQFPMKNIDLASFLRQLSRWYDVEVQYKGPPNKRIFGGLMSRDVQLSSVLKALEVYGLHSKLENRILIVE